MNLIIDSNILIAAIIRNSITRKLLFDKRFFYFAPSLILEETNKYNSMIKEKTQFSDEEYLFLINSLLKNITIFQTEKLVPYKEEAYNIIKEIDENDALFIATALAIPDSILWSEDRRLGKQTKVRVITTSELLDLLKEMQ
ncbi:MAG TPA: PIN domain-containing protein [Candidatus Nanoarchaeia archaeon]|nr:PIN domain-containing protein [Candidatus Nanoarchaeia archaeon]